jgi:hypothetical protein
MKSFTTLTAVAAPFDMANIDTDRIIRAHGDAGGIPLQSTPNLRTHCGFLPRDHRESTA